MSVSPAEPLDSPSTRRYVTSLTVSRPFLTPDEISTLRRKTCPSLSTYVARRRQAATVLAYVIRQLKFPSKLLHTALTYYQHFYLHHVFNSDHHTDVAVTCLFLASKTCDTIKKLRDILAAAQSVNPDDGVPYPGFIVNNESLDDQRRRVMHWEKKLLEVMSFDFRNNINCSVDSFLVKYLKAAIPDTTTVVGENMKFLSYVLTFDVANTDMSLSYPSHVIALACIQLAGCLDESYALLDSGPLSRSQHDSLLESINTRSMDKFRVPTSLVRGAYRALLEFYHENYQVSQLARYATESPIFHDLLERTQASSWRERDVAHDRYIQAIVGHERGSNGATKETVSNRFMLGNKRSRFTMETR